MMFFPAVLGTAAVYEKNRAIASINQKGKIEVVSFKEKRNFFAEKIWFIRGISILIFGLYLYLISLSGSKTFFERGNQERKTKPSASVVILTSIGVIGFVCFSFLIPSFKKSFRAAKRN